jgi:hypothetical protein
MGGLQEIGKPQDGLAWIYDPGLQPGTPGLVRGGTNGRPSCLVHEADAGQVEVDRIAVGAQQVGNQAQLAVRGSVDLSLQEHCPATLRAVM